MMNDLSRNVPTIEEIDLFLGLAEHARTYNPEKKKMTGITPDELREKLKPTTITWLVAHHIISIHEGRDVWLAFTNKKFPNYTIDTLTQWNEERKLVAETLL